MGDQPASLFGQSCVHSGAKITFGTGAMLDMVHGTEAPTTLSTLRFGLLPDGLRSTDDTVTWGVEGIVFSAGSCVEWLVDLGLIDEPRQSPRRSPRRVATTEGVSFVPAFSGPRHAPVGLRRARGVLRTDPRFFARPPGTRGLGGHRPARCRPPRRRRTRDQSQPRRTSRRRRHER